MAVLKARTEFAAALNQVCAERGIEPDVVLETIKEAILAAFRRDFGLKEDFEYGAQVDPENGQARIFGWPEGQEEKKEEVTPPGFGRIATQVAKQVLLQKIREAEKNAILDEFTKRIGTLVNGLILRFDGHNIIVDINKTEAVFPPQEQIRSEKYHLNQRLTFYIKEIRDTERGRNIIVSRADKSLVEALFRREVPEISSGAVEIREIAREAGARTKIAVVSTQTGVDPVGSCVGQKGVRVQAVIGELEGEKIDIIQYSDDSEKYIMAALSPAEGVKVELNEKKKTAVISVPDDQLSLAIGSEGQNVRLASKLTGYKLDIKGSKKSSAASAASKGKTDEIKLELVKAGLSTRVARLLDSAGITTLAQLKKTDVKELGQVKGLGPKALAEIKALSK